MMPLRKSTAILIILLVAASGSLVLPAAPAAVGAEGGKTVGLPIKYKGKISIEAEATGSGVVSWRGEELAVVEVTQKIRSFILPFKVEFSESFGSLTKEERKISDAKVGDYLFAQLLSENDVYFDVEWSFSLGGAASDVSVTLCGHNTGKFTTKGNIMAIGLMRLGQKGEKQIAVAANAEAILDPPTTCSISFVRLVDNEVQMQYTRQLDLGGSYQILDDALYDCCGVDIDDVSVVDASGSRVHYTKFFAEAEPSLPVEGGWIEYPEKKIKGSRWEVLRLEGFKYDVVYRLTEDLELEEGLVTCGLAISSSAKKPDNPTAIPEIKASEAITAAMGTEEAKEKLVCINCRDKLSTLLPENFERRLSIPDKEKGSEEEKNIPSGYITFDSDGGTHYKHHMMQMSLIDPLRKLTLLTYNEWQDGANLNINAAYDFQRNIHTTRSLHSEGRAIDLGLVVKGAKAGQGLLARVAWLAHEAGFDWSYNEWAGATEIFCNHVHVSKKGIHTNVLTGKVKVTGLFGKVEVRRAGSGGEEVLTATQGFVVQVGDIITTSEDSIVQIQVEPVSPTGMPTVITLAGNSKIQIEEPWLISITTGKIHLKVECRAFGCSIVRSPKLDVAIGGTELTVEITADGATTVTVFEGTVEATHSESGETLSLSSNQQFTAPGSGTLTQQEMQQRITTVNPNTLDRWWQPKQTTTSLLLSSNNIVFGEKVSLTVALTPTESLGTVTIQHSRDQTTWTDITTGSLTLGRLTFQFEPELTGTNYFRATYPKNDQYQASTSSIIFLNVRPRVETFKATVDQRDFTILVVSNSTLSDIKFDQTGKSILLSAKSRTGKASIGATEVSYPSNLLNGTLTVTLDNTPLQFKQAQNSTHITISTSYPQTDSPKTLRVQGTVVVPEFPQSTILLVFATTLIAFIVQRAFRRASNRPYSGKTTLRFTH